MESLPVKPRRFGKRGVPLEGFVVVNADKRRIQGFQAVRMRHIADPRAGIEYFFSGSGPLNAHVQAVILRSEQQGEGSWRCKNDLLQVFQRRSGFDQRREFGRTSPGIKQDVYFFHEISLGLGHDDHLDLVDFDELKVFPPASLAGVDPDCDILMGEQRQRLM